MRVGCGGCTDVDVVDRTVGRGLPCCPPGGFIMQLDDGGRDGRCDKGSGSEGGLMLVVPELVKRDLLDDI